MMRIPLTLLGLAFILPLLTGCLTEMAHKYTFSEEDEYVYFRRVVSASERGKIFSICLEPAAEAAPAVLAELEAGPDHRLTEGPFGRYVANVAPMEAASRCAAGGLLAIAAGRFELLLPDDRLVQLPDLALGALPVFLGGMTAAEMGRVDTLRFDGKSRNVYLFRGTELHGRLERVPAARVPKPYRDDYVFGSIYYLQAVRMLPSESVPTGLAPIRVTNLPGRGLLSVYYRGQHGRLERAFFARPDKNERITLLFPYHSKEPVGFRPWGLCLYPPAVVGDILTGIFQVFIFYEDLKRGKCPN